MDRLKYLLIFFLILFSCGHLVAQTRGCLIGGRIYYTNKVDLSFFGFLPRESYSGAVSYPYIASSTYTCPPNDYDDYALFVSQPTNAGSSIDCNKDVNTWGAAIGGKVYIFKVFRCSLDDYIWLMILPTGLLGGYLLRRKNFPYLG